MAGAVDLFSGTGSISGSNLFYVDKNPLDQFINTLSDIGQRDSLLETFETFVQGVIDQVVEFFETLTGLNINEGPILFFASVFERLENITGLDWSHGPIDFLVSIVEAVVNSIEALTGLNINEGVEPFLASLWTNLENVTGLNWNEGPINFLISLVDAVVNAFETLTSLNINEGPGPFFDSLWAALEAATGLVWSEGPIPFLTSAVEATINTIEVLTGLNINEGPEAFLNSFWIALENATGFDWTNGPVAFLESVVSVTVTAIENLTNLNIDEGPIKFFESLFTALESATNLDWTHGPVPFVQSIVTNVIASIEYLTGLNIDAGPEAFINSLFYEIITGPSVALGEMMQALDATGVGLAEKIGRAIIAVISGIPFVGEAIADTLTDLLDGLVLWVRGGNQSGTNLLNDPGAENAKFWEAKYPTNYPTVALRGTRKQPEVTRDTTVKRSAGASLRVTSGGLDPKSFYWNINDLGDIVPISTTVGDWFYAECYVFVPSTNTGSAAVTLVAEFRNSTDINTITTETVTLGVVKSSGLTDPWQKIAGTFYVPSGYDRISFGFLLGAGNTTTGDKFYVDDMMVREVTGTQSTLQGIHKAIRGGDGTSLISLSAVGTALGGITDLTRGTSEAGSNLLVDPKASYSGLWIATGLSTSKAVGTYKSASQSLVFTSAGATPRSFDWTVNDTGATTPIVAQPGDIFYCECYVLSPPGNSSATVTLHGKARNSSTGATFTLTPQLTASPVASGPWTKISGQYTIPSTGYDQFIAGITLGGGATTSGDKFYIDDMVVREVTGTQTTIDALGQAVDPSNGTGNDITNVRDAVASVFDLAQGATQSGVNLLADPKANYTRLWMQTGLSTSPLYYNSTSQSLRFTTLDGSTRSFQWTVGKVSNIGNVVPITTQAGKIFYCECYVYLADTNPNTTATVTMFAQNTTLPATTGADIAPMTFTAAGTWSLTTLTNPAKGAPWTKLFGYFSMPSGDGFTAGIRFSAAATHAVHVDDMVIYDVTDSVKANNQLYGRPTPTTAINLASVPTGISQANIAGSLTASLSGDISSISGVASGASGKAQDTIDGIVSAVGAYSGTNLGANYVTASLQQLNQALFRSNTYPGASGTVSVNAVPALGRDKVQDLKDTIDNINNAFNATPTLNNSPAVVTTWLQRLNSNLWGTNTMVATGATVKDAATPIVQKFTEGYKGTTGRTYSASDAQTASDSIRSAAAALSAQVTKLTSTTGGAAYAGNSASVAFTDSTATTMTGAGFTNRLIVGDAGLTVSGGAAVFSGAQNPATINAVYTSKLATNAYQKVGIVFAGQDGGKSYIYARMNAAGTNYVYASFYNKTIELGYNIGSGNTLLASLTYSGLFAAAYWVGAPYWLECGYNGNPGTYRLMAGDSPVLVANDITTRLTTNFYTGFGGTGLGSANLPGSVGAFAFYDNTPPTSYGSGFRVTRTTAYTTTVPFPSTGQIIPNTDTARTNPATWPNTVFPATAERITAEYTWSNTTNGLTIKVSGWYHVVVSARQLAVTGNGYFFTVGVKKNSTVQSMGADGGPGTYVSHCSTIVYCAKGDILYPVYLNNFSSSVGVCGEALGVNTYFSASFLNNTTPVQPT